MLAANRFENILEKFTTLDPVLVLGDIGVDKYTKGRVNRISPEAPVPVVEVFQEWNKLGLAANVSDNLQSLKVPTTICGVIGNDSNGNILESLLEERGLSTWGVVRSEERMTTFKERVVTDVQQVCRVDYETKDELDHDTRTRLLTRINDFIDQHSAIILEDYGKGLLNNQFITEIMALGKKHNKFIAADPSRISDPLLYKGVNLLKPNRLESELMAKMLGYNEKNTERIAEILIDKLELEKLIITLGPDGMAIFDTAVDSSKMKLIPTVAREVYDVSGAGDTAISTIVSALICGATLEEAAWFGNCASGVVIGKRGTALVTQEELREIYQELNQLQ